MHTGDYHVILSVLALGLDEGSTLDNRLSYFFEIFRRSGFNNALTARTLLPNQLQYAQRGPSNYILRRPVGTLCRSSTSPVLSNIIRLERPLGDLGQVWSNDLVYRKHRVFVP